MLNRIVNAVCKKRPTLTLNEARAVATDIFYSGEDVEDVLASESVVDKLLINYRTRASSSERSVVANDPTTCPICNTVLKPVKLANDRDAVFCQKHFVVFPVKPTSKGKA